MSDLDYPLFSMANTPFTIRNACEGVGIFGGTGSGKSSGSGATLAQNYLDTGFGGLVLTVKPDDKADWLQWAEEAGRLDDVIIFSPENPYHFDFLLYEQQRGNARTVNVVDLIDTAVEIINDNKSGHSSGGDDDFWKDAGSQLISKTVDLLLLAGAPLTVANMLETINSAPTSPDDFDKLRPQENEKGEFEFTTPFAACMGGINERYSELSKEDLQKARVMTDYFLRDYALLGEVTRASVRMQITTTLYQLVSEDVGALLCSGRNDDYFTPPEMTYLEGKIIILDMPVMKWKKTGKLMQGLYKYLFQRCIEARNFKKRTRPVFLWSDEAQYFLTSHDQLFLTTARSTGCCTVFLTQNIENFYEVIGEHTTRSLLGNLQTKIFHQNTDMATNNYASDLIGQRWQSVANRSIGGEVTVGSSDQLVKLYQPEQFNTLRTGGTPNNLEVEAVVIRASYPGFMSVVFKQG